MNIVILSHPEFTEIKSIKRFTEMLRSGLSSKGHRVEVYTPEAVLMNKLKIPGLRKWMGYIDSLLIFPMRFKRLMKNMPHDTLFVLTDNALGPWMSMLKDKPHVIHCHDFLAYYSSTGKITENPTSSTGKIYQNLIKKGFCQGKNFISVSKKTKADLENILSEKPRLSEVIYNGLNPVFSPIDVRTSRNEISRLCSADLSAGYIMNIGVNVWYKNKIGVMKIYEKWRETTGKSLPLLMVGPNPGIEVQDRIKVSPYASDIFMIENLSDEQIVKCYSGASVMLFPSLYEGFGWPIAEALACACPVITTNEAPMNEVGSTFAYYINKMPKESALQDTWALSSANELDRVLSLQDEEISTSKSNGIRYAKGFNQIDTMDKIENIYHRIFEQYGIKERSTVN